MGCKRKTMAEEKMPSSDGPPDRKPKPEPAPAVSSMVTYHQPPEDGGRLQVQELALGAAEEDVVKLLDSDVPKTVLRCDVCHVLKLSVFQCSLMRHVACGDCGAGECRPCADLGDAAVVYVQSSYLDTLFGYIKVLCPYKKHGCPSSVAYRDVVAHAAACAHGPCACPKCSFEGSPAELVRHLTDEAGQHAWPVRSITYGSDQVFDIDMRELKQRDPRGATVGLFLLVAEEEDDGGVFLLAVGSYSDGAHYVSVLCIRSNNADTAGPVYSSSVIVEGPPAKVRRQKMEKKAVASCSVPILFDVEKEPECNVVLAFPEDLHGNEMHLFVCIDKV